MAILLFICVSTILGLISAQSATPGVKSCVVETTTGIVDLTPLGNQDGTPRFKDISGPNQQYTYSWNPCFGYQDVDPCQGVQLCQHSVTTSFNLGSDSTAEFVQNTTHLFLVYTTTTDVTVRRSFIQLICDQNEEGEFAVQGEGPKTIYRFSVRSKHACHKALSPTPQGLPTASNSTALMPTTTSVPPTPAVFNLKTITILLGCILLSLCLLICQVFVGLITRKSEKDTSPYEEKRKF